MLWLITKNNSYSITACNTHFKDGKHQLWVERTNGKSVLLYENENLEEVNTVRDAIHYAIEKDAKVLAI